MSFCHVCICVCVCCSGAYRPVRAESGEYLYCPPQRWLNNVHVSYSSCLYLLTHHSIITVTVYYSTLRDICVHGIREKQHGHIFVNLLFQHYARLM